MAVRTTIPNFEFSGFYYFDILRDVLRYLRINVPEITDESDEEREVEHGADVPEPDVQVAVFADKHMQVGVAFSRVMQGFARATSEVRLMRMVGGLAVRHIPLVERIPHAGDRQDGQHENRHPLHVATEVLEKAAHRHAPAGV